LFPLPESASQAKQVVSGGVEPISVIQIKNRVFGIPISNKIMLRLVCVGWHKDLFGMAYFKWRTDDILDETGDPSVIGKDTGKDTGKTTFITFCGLNGARQLSNELIDTAQLSLKPLKSRGELLHSFAEFVRNRSR